MRANTTAVFMRSTRLFLRVLIPHFDKVSSEFIIELPYRVSAGTPFILHVRVAPVPTAQLAVLLNLASVDSQACTAAWDAANHDERPKRRRSLTPTIVV